MNTRLTVADVRSQLYYIINPDDPNDPKFLRYLNEICERYIYSGKWKGALVYVNFASADPFITLPAEYYGVLMMRYDRWPAPIFSQFHSYMENGPGQMEDTETFPGMLMDLGDGYPTQTDIPSGSSGVLRVKITNASDANKSIWFDGEDADGAVVYSGSGIKGVGLTTANPSADTTQAFSKVTGIQAPANMVAPWTLWWVSSGGVETQIGTYRPWETRPMYHRYQTGVAEKAITTICQRRFMPMRSETDWVIPGNLTALRYGLLALTYENSDRIDSAANAFNIGIQYLNNEAKASRAGARAPMVLEQWSYGLGGFDYTN